MWVPGMLRSVGEESPCSSSKLCSFLVFHYEFACGHHLHTLHLLGLQQAPASLFHGYRGGGAGFNTNEGRHSLSSCRRISPGLGLFLCCLYGGMIEQWSWTKEMTFLLAFPTLQLFVASPRISYLGRGGYHSALFPYPSFFNPTRIAALPLDALVE